MIVRQLRHPMSETERHFVQIIVEFDVLRTRLVDLVTSYRAERAELKRQIPQDVPEAMFVPLVQTPPPKKRSVRRQIKRKQRARARR